MQANKKNKNKCRPLITPHTLLRNNAGFTLLELLAAVAILGIVTMMAIPSMSRWVAHYRLVGSTNEMASALRMAQSQAVIRKREVWFCAKHTHQSGCGYGSKNFHQWLVAVPALGQTSTSANENVLHQIDISSSLQVRDCLLNDTTFKVAADGRFYKRESRDIHVRICSPQLEGNNGTREIRVNGALIQVSKTDASCSRWASCT